MFAVIADRKNAQHRVGFRELGLDEVLLLEEVVQLEAIDVEVVKADDKFALVVVIGTMG